MLQAELAAAKHMLSYFSSPCFSVKIVYNYGLGPRQIVLTEILLSKLYRMTMPDQVKLQTRQERDDQCNYAFFRQLVEGVLRHKTQQFISGYSDIYYSLYGYHRYHIHILYIGLNMSYQLKLDTIYSAEEKKKFIL